MARSRDSPDRSRGCCAKCGECLIITFNVLAIIMSLIIIAFGAVLLASVSIASTYASNFEVQYAGNSIAFTPLITQLQYTFLNPVGIAFVVVGAVLFIFSIVGCCAAMKHQCCSMTIYCIFVGIISIGLIVTVILFSVDQTLIISQIGNYWQQNMVWQYYADVPVFQNTSSLPSMPIVVGFSTNYWMYSSACCGINSYQDMNESSYWNSTYQFSTGSNGSFTCTNAVVPPVCCQNISTIANSFGLTSATSLCNCMKYPTAQNSYMNTPCFQQLYSSSYYSTYKGLVYPIVVGVWAGFGGLLFIFFVYAIYLAVVYRKRDNRDNDRDYYDGNNAHVAVDRNKYDRTLPMQTTQGVGNANPAYMGEASAPPAYTSAPNYGIYAPPTSNAGAPAGPYQLPRF